MFKKLKNINNAIGIRINNKFLILLLIITFIFSLAISVYHFGIEQGFFDESPVCGLKNAAEIISKEDLLKQAEDIHSGLKRLSLKNRKVVMPHHKEFELIEELEELSIDLIEKLKN